jgi:hypothetical protein
MDGQSIVNDAICDALTELSNLQFVAEKVRRRNGRASQAEAARPKAKRAPAAAVEDE